MNIGSIVVGERLREDMGDLDELAESIQRLGLFHPIVIDSDYNLIAGCRRLEACKRLGWEDVPVRELGELTEAERREIELEENLRRKDLTAYEHSKFTVELEETIREREMGESPTQQAIADEVGVDRKTLREAERHVETADAHPFMQRQDWKQYHVLEAREKLEALPEQERPKAVALMAQPGLSPKTAIKVLANVSAMPEPERERIYTLAESNDSRERTLALTEAVQRPAMPDPRIDAIGEAQRLLRIGVREFPDDPFTPDIKAEIEHLQTIKQCIKDVAQR